MALLDPWGFDGKTYDAKEFRQLIDALFYTEGVVDQLDFAVTQQASPGTTVQVAAGQAIVTATTAGELGKYLQPNDATMNSPAFTATSANGRKDRLILRITAGVGAIQIVEGTPSGSPAEPSITGDNYLELALITLPGSTTNITTAMITDRRANAAPYGSNTIGTSSTRPANPRYGQHHYQTDDSREVVWNGAAWVTVTPVSAETATSETRTNAAYGNLSGGATGPAVSLQTGTKALVTLSGNINNSGGTSAVFMGFAVSGASTVAGSDSKALALVGAAGHQMQAGITYPITGLTAGVNTFTAVYRAAAGTITASVRSITVVGIP